MMKSGGSGNNIRDNNDINEEQFLANEESMIVKIQNDLDRVQNITDMTLNILSGLEMKLVKLADTIEPVHKQTQTLTHAQRNIDDTLKAVDVIIAHTRVADESDVGINRPKLTEDAHGYVRWLYSVNEALLFFENKTNLKNTTLKRLKDLQKSGTHEVENEFANLLGETNIRVNQAYDSSGELPDDFDLLPSSTVERLNLFAECLDCMGSYGFVPTLQDLRSASLKKTLKYMLAERENVSKGTDSGHMLYTCGTHKVVPLMRFFLQLLRHEFELLRSILHTTNMDSSEFDATFHGIVGMPLEYMQRKVSALVSKEKGANSVLVLLDVLRVLDEVVPEYTELLKKEQHVLNAVLLPDMVTQLRNATQHYCESILSYQGEQSSSAKQLSKDGTVYTLSIQTVNFVKALSEYTLEVEKHSQAFVNLLDGVTEEFLGENTFGSVVSVTFLALEKNLVQKAKDYKSASLAAIFLLNNYNYVMRAVRRTTWYPCLGDRFFTRYEQEVRIHREQYNHATWDKAMRFLSLDDKGEVLKKCLPQMTSSGKRAIKAKFSGFNQQLDLLSEAQRKYAVPDMDIRHILREDNLQTVIPAYEAFMSTYAHLPFSKNPAVYDKFNKKTLEGLLGRFFDEDA